MPPSTFFTRFGLLVARGFFDAEFCARLRAEIRAASTRPAEIRTGGANYAVNEAIRRVGWADVSSVAVASVESRLLAFKPRLEAHFALSLHHHQTPQFLCYRPGDFYQPHRDSSIEPDADPVVQERSVSISIFLNAESAEPAPDSYGGGALTFYRLVDDPRAKSIGLPLIGEEGLLVAFRADTIHSVEPVTHGERYTVVTWYAGGPPAAATFLSGAPTAPPPA